MNYTETLKQNTEPNPPKTGFWLILLWFAIMFLIRNF